MRQGPHQGAQKSTTTGRLLLNTSFSKEASLISMTPAGLYPHRDKYVAGFTVGQLQGVGKPNLRTVFEPGGIVTSNFLPFRVSNLVAPPVVSSGVRNNSYLTLSAFIGISPAYN
jgi:hypothetical protein